MASYFWVGGSGTWDSSTTTHWATSSGGAGSAGVPTATDTATFDSNSTGTVTIGTSAVCLTVTCSGTYAGTWAFGTTGSLNIHGSMTLLSTMTVTGTTGLITFSATTTGFTITTAGKLPTPTSTVAGVNVTFNGVGGGWTLQDTNNMGTVTVTNGSLNTNAETCTWFAFSSSNANTRTVTFGASSITLTSNGTSWQTGTTTGLTFSAASSTIIHTNSSGWNPGSLTFGTVTFNGNGTLNFAGAFTAGTLNLAPITPGVTDAIQMAANFTINTQLTITGGAAPNRYLISSNVLGTQRTITNNGTNTISYCDFSDTKGAGTASWNLSAATGLSGNCGGNATITFTTAATSYWVGNGGNWSTAASWASSSGGAASSGRVPLPQDSAVFDANSFSSGSQNFAFDTNRIGGFNFTGVTNAPTYKWNVALGVFIYGSVNYAGLTRVGGSGGPVMAGRGSFTITTGGSAPASLIVQAPGGTYTLQDAYSAGGNNIEVEAGTLNDGGQAVSSSASVSLSVAGFTTATRALTMSGVWTLSGTGTLVSAATATNLTLTATGSKIICSDTSATAKAFTTASTLTWGVVQVATGGAGTFQFDGGGTYAGITAASSSSQEQTIIFTSSETFTISTAAGWNVNGFSATKIISVVSGTAGTAATISCASGVVVSNFISLKDNTATGGATFIAENPTFVSDVTGWQIGLTTAITGSLTVTDASTDPTSKVALTSSVSVSVSVAAANKEAVALTASSSGSASVAGTNTEAVALTSAPSASAAVTAANTEAVALIAASEAGALAGVSSLGPYRTAVLADSPLGFWPLDDIEGGIARDLSGNGFNGALGAHVTEGGLAPPNGLASMVFQGTATGDVIITPNITGINSSSGMTFETWVNFTGAGEQGILWFTGGTLIMLYVDNELSLDFSGVVKLSGSGALNTGTWHHLVQTVASGLTPAWTQYVDGVSLIGGASGPSGAGTGFLYIGTPDSQGAQYNGKQANTAIYAGVLSATRVLAHWTAGIGPGNQESVAVSVGFTASSSVAAVNTEAVTISSAISSSMTVTAADSVLVGETVSISASSSVAAANTEAVALTASSSGSASVAGTNTEAVALTASSSGSASVAGTNTEAVALTASIGASLDVESDFTVVALLTVAITASLSVSGDSTESVDLSTVEILGTSDVEAANTETAELSTSITVQSAVTAVNAESVVLSSAIVSTLSIDVEGPDAAIALTASIVSSSVVSAVALWTATAAGSIVGTFVSSGAGFVVLPGAGTATWVFTTDTADLVFTVASAGLVFTTDEAELIFE